MCVCGAGRVEDLVKEEWTESIFFFFEKGQEIITVLLCSFCE